MTSDLFTQSIRSIFKCECVKEFAFHPKRRWRFDYAIPEYRIAIEVEGGVWTQGRHTRAKGFLGDMDKYNTAAVMGWTLVRTTPNKLMTKQTMDFIQQALQWKKDMEAEVKK